MDNLARVSIDLPAEEIIEGKTYLMSPRPRPVHNIIVTNISRIIGNYLVGKTCRVFSDGMDVHLDDDNVYVPDVMIVCDRSKVHHDGLHGAPDLVVEVLSPSTALHDRGPKMKHYAAAGVKEYWIVSPTSKSVEVYLNEDGRFQIDNIYTDYDDEDVARMDEKEHAAIRWDIPVSLYDDFRVSVKDVFDDVDDFL